MKSSTSTLGQPVRHVLPDAGACRSRAEEQGRRSDERGVAIILAMLFVVIAGGLVTSGSILMKSASDRSEVRFRREAQARQFARSGLTEALSWMRRQTSQPVMDFKPLLDPSALIRVMDTDDPVIGLVREFEIAEDIWGRYEVWREDESDPDPTRLAFRRKYQVADVSTARGFSGAGNVWLIRSLGYVYQKRDDTKQWNEQPNRVLAISTLEGEVRRLTLQPPGQAAICVSEGGACAINSYGRVIGGSTGAGILYPVGTGTPSTGAAWKNRVTGSPALSATSVYGDSIEAVFGVSRDELRSMATLVVTNQDEFPDPVPDNAIIFVEVPALDLDSTRGLNGTGIVFVSGQVTLAAGNNSSFNGLLYVEGDFEMRQTSDIYGALVCTGSIKLKGSGDYATVSYDDDVLGSLRTHVGQYMWVGAFRPVINRE
ncbi:MAG: hypothetical protein VX951_11495 [Planctomycetota bacterium]|nr:hypothetical protein [Planctomycetota bacterium]